MYQIIVLIILSLSFFQCFMYTHSHNEKWNSNGLSHTVYTEWQDACRLPTFGRMAPRFTCGLPRWSCGCGSPGSAPSWRPWWRRSGGGGGGGCAPRGQTGRTCGGSPGGRRCPNASWPRAGARGTASATGTTRSACACASRAAWSRSPCASPPTWT